YNDYQLYAHDYDYKFAMAQIENVRNFTVVLYYASAVFSVLISIILVCYSVKKHSSEIYILRSLGESRMKIALGITAESFVICLSAVILGTLLCSVLGSAVCDAVNAYTFERASHAAESLSEAAEFMRNADALKAQLQSAIHSFESVGYRISYRSPGKEFVFFPCLIAVLTLLTLVLSAVAVNKNMMKREV
ncbi:MAG: FtsX-like permease family protein, partial [Clostridia bacterium]|nr:FtsX-like permease family protein [Clostridia bacterium]